MRASGRAPTGRLPACLGEAWGACEGLPGVHAKAVITAGATLFGSANLTESGFGARDEIGMPGPGRGPGQDAAGLV